MTAAAEAAGVANAVAFEYRYGSAQQALKELVVNGHLAPLRQIEVARFGTEMRLETKRPRSSWWYDRTKGGGLANAFMPHIVDLALWLGGAPVRGASGFLRTANPERRDPSDAVYPSDVSDGCFALADLGEGVAARMTVDGTLSFAQSTIALHSEHRTAIATGSQLTNMGLIIVENGEPDEYDLKESPYEKYRPVYASVPQFLSLLDDFAAKIAGEPSNVPTFADGLAAQRVLATIGYDLP
jgi:predicted dehydrogenase